MKLDSILNKRGVSHKGRTCRNLLYLTNWISEELELAFENKLNILRPYCPIMPNNTKRATHPAL